MDLYFYLWNATEDNLRAQYWQRTGLNDQVISVGSFRCFNAVRSHIGSHPPYWYRLRSTIEAQVIRSCSGYLSYLCLELSSDQHPLLKEKGNIASPNLYNLLTLPSYWNLWSFKKILYNNFKLLENTVDTVYLYWESQIKIFSEVL